MDAPFNPLLLAAGATACAATTLGAARAAWGGFQRRGALRRRYAAGRAAFARLVSETAARAQARLGQAVAWEGTRPLRVAAIVDECVGMKSFYLVSPDGKPLPRFHPGQYLTLELPGPHRDKPVVRCYSLSDRPREEYFRITVKRQSPPPGRDDLPDGIGSGWLHSRVSVGDTLLCAAPRGAFFLAPDNPAPVALIGGGVGLTPVVAMVNALCHAGGGQPVHLFVGARSSAEHPFKQHLEGLARQHDNLRLFVAYSQPLPQDQLHRDYQRAGRVTIDYLRETLPSNNLKFYLCGPPAMMQALVPDLLEWGAPDDSIAFEAFGPASVRLPGERNPAAEAIGSEVRFARRGADAVWGAGDGTLLELAERVGAPIAAGCRAGNCGQCVTRVLSGEVTAVRPPGAKAPPGCCLACISVPKGPVVLDV